MEARAEERFSQRTAWTRSLEEPLRSFLRTETGSASVLLAAAVAALIWANVSPSTYQSVWHTVLSIRIGGSGVALTLRGWIDQGLMAFFFLVVGVEARREFDLGELRERRRLFLPVMAALGGMVIPIGIFLIFNGGKSSSHGWGTAMSTDTAFALGMLALVGRRFPASLRTFMLTVAVVDDLVAFAVIATAYSSSIHVVGLAVGLGAIAVLVALRLRRVRNGAVVAVVGLVGWVALLKSGVDPVIVGVVIGLLAIAYPASRSDLEHATDLFRLFREQPTSELAQSAREGVRTALSPNERLQHIYHPVSSYVIVPLFALANAGVHVNGSFLGHAYGSAITLGILIGYVVGKPLGIAGLTWLTTRVSRGRVRPPVGWASVLGGGTIAGIGFTVSLLIATLAFHGVELDEAKLGVLTAGVLAALLTWLELQAVGRLPRAVRLKAFLGTSQPIQDLVVAVDPERDHVRGPADAPVTLVEYGDFECPYCGQAETVIRELLTDFGDLRYVWRHLPLNDVHPHADLAAEAAEAAAAQGQFWEMHDRLLSHQDQLTVRELVGHAQELGLEVEEFRDYLRKRKGAAKVLADVDSADQSNVSGTPTFFINGRRHYGVYDLQTLSGEVKAARARAAVEALGRPAPAPENAGVEPEPAPEDAGVEPAPS